MTSRPDAELVLVKRLQTGDTTAVTDLAAAYSSRIRQLAFRYVKNREDAEEVTQDVLLKIVRKIGAFRGDSALSSWIHRITFNASMSRLRNARLSRPLEVPAPGRGPSADDRRRPWGGREAADWSSLADEAVLRQQMRQRLEQAMRDLPPIYRTPIVLRDLHGLSTEEASRVLKLKTQTLKSRLHRGRVILRRRLAEFSGGLSLHPAA